MNVLTILVFAFCQMLTSAATVDSVSAMPSLLSTKAVLVMNARLARLNVKNKKAITRVFEEKLLKDLHKEFEINLEWRKLSKNSQDQYLQLIMDLIIFSQLRIRQGFANNPNKRSQSSFYGIDSMHFSYGMQNPRVFAYKTSFRGFDDLTKAMNKIHGIKISLLYFINGKQVEEVTNFPSNRSAVKYNYDFVSGDLFEPFYKLIFQSGLELKVPIIGMDESLAMLARRYGN